MNNLSSSLKKSLYITWAICSAVVLFAAIGIAVLADGEINDAGKMVIAIIYGLTLGACMRLSAKKVWESAFGKDGIAFATDTSTKVGLAMRALAAWFVGGLITNLFIFAMGTFGAFVGLAVAMAGAGYFGVLYANQLVEHRSATSPQ